MRTLKGVDVGTAVVVAGLGGLLLGVLLGPLVAPLGSRRREAPEQADAPHPTRPAAAGGLPPEVSALLSVLRSAGVVLDESDRIITMSPAAVSQGLVRSGSLVYPELVQLARQVRRDGGILDVDLELARSGLRRRGAARHRLLRARVARFDARHVLLLVEDRSEARRLEETRRDFVANVSHELKTPIGGISLLSEAILHATDDSEAVTRFAERIHAEAGRLTGLVRDIVDLSRLESLDLLIEPSVVDVSDVAREAIELSQVAADAKGITTVHVPAPSCRVWGQHELLVSAVRNLVANAIAYSEPGTRVTVAVRGSADQVEVAVTDQGHGIPEPHQQRIFERFYRVDDARSRATGGTGLGLSIVKHVCVNHGGDVAVWSEPGRGSTFTIRLPALDPALDPAPLGHPATRAPAHPAAGQEAT